MRSRKLLATMTLVALLGSDLVLAASAALGQTPTPWNGYPTGNGYPMAPTPALGGADGAYGRMLPGPSTTAPYVEPRQMPLLTVPPAQPQMIQRPAGPTGPNVCQPGGGPRAYQTVSIPRARPAEPLPLPFQQGSQGTTVAQGATVTQVTVSQGVPAPQIQTGQTQLSQQPTQDLRTPAALAPSAPEVEELSRIEAGFNLDPVRVQQIGSMQQVGSMQQIGSMQQPQSPQQAQQAALAQQSQLRQVAQDQASQAYLGPFGAPLRQYGYAMFAANVSTFAPVDDIPIGPDYVLNPGDDLTINV